MSAVSAAFRQAYTAVVSGVGGLIATGLVEIYNLAERVILRCE